MRIQSHTLSSRGALPSPLPLQRHKNTEICRSSGTKSQPVLCAAVAGWILLYTIGCAAGAAATRVAPPGGPRPRAGAPKGPGQGQRRGREGPARCYGRGGLRATTYAATSVPRVLSAISPMSRGADTPTDPGPPELPRGVAPTGVAQVELAGVYAEPLEKGVPTLLRLEKRLGPGSAVV